MYVLILLAVVLILGYLIFAGGRIGLHQRLPLALGPISLERIPDRAANRYGERPLFTTDEPCRWEVPALRERYPDPRVWPAERVRSTAGFVGAMLQERYDLRRDERVAILKENHLDVQVFTAAVVRAGGIACPINGKFAAEKLEAYLTNVEARVLISDPPTLRRILLEVGGLGPVRHVVLAAARSGSEALEATEIEKLVGGSYPDLVLDWIEESLLQVATPCRAVPRGPEEPLYLVHSSGTTGFPKAVILKNGAQSHAVRGWLCYVHISRRHDRGYLAVPTNHQAVILTFNSLLLLGVRTHWTAAYDREGFDAERVTRELAEGGFTGFFGFPILYTQLKEVCLEAYDLGRMRFWATTADASHESIQRCFVRVGGVFRALRIPVEGSVFLDAQGSSEVGTPSVLRYVTPFTRRFARRVGKPGSTPFGPRIRITGDDGKPARRGDVGRLEVRGRTVFPAYWNNHSLTYQAIRDGWFFTGDVARISEDGHIVQLDREVDVIRTRNGPVYSLPIEEKIHFHSAVFDACVYGARKEDGTQLPAAAIAVREGVEIECERLREELNALLEKGERLSHLEIMPWSEFPIGITGKTLKRVFRERMEPVPVIEQNRPLTWHFLEPSADRATTRIASGESRVVRLPGLELSNPQPDEASDAPPLDVTP